MFYFKNDKEVSVYFSNGSIAVWKQDNPQFQRVVEMCELNKWIEIETLHNQAKVIMTADTSIENGQVVVRVGSETIQVEEDALTKMIQLLRDKGCIIDGQNIDVVKPFLRNMLENPYINAVHEIFQYCEAGDFEITDDGCLLAYKYVNKDLTSCYDNKTKHALNEMTEVQNFNTDRNQTCSNGLHFCSKSYLSNYGFGGSNTIIIIKVNPKDIVSIPTDYNYAKGRCKKYMMVGYMAKDGSLATTNIQAATGQNVVKSDATKKADKASKKPKDRLDETAQWMEKYNNNRESVANIMNISVETVRRNMQKYRARERNG